MKTLQELISLTDAERVGKARDFFDSISLYDSSGKLMIYGGGNRFRKSRNIKDIDISKTITFSFYIRSSGRQHQSIIQFPNGLGMNMPVRLKCTCLE